jgi:hypothetical protein
MAVKVRRADMLTELEGGCFCNVTGDGQMFGGRPDSAPPPVFVRYAASCTNDIHTTSVRSSCPTAQGNLKETRCSENDSSIVSAELTRHSLSSQMVSSHRGEPLTEFKATFAMFIGAVSRISYSARSSPLLSINMMAFWLCFVQHLGFLVPISLIRMTV